MPSPRSVVLTAAVAGAAVALTVAQADASHLAARLRDGGGDRHAATAAGGARRAAPVEAGLLGLRRLERMTPFDGDRLDPALTHGDVLLMLSAHSTDTVAHALRELMRPVRAAFALRRWLDGFQGAARGRPRRNLFGFRDGTGNPDVDDDALMRRLVWTADGGTHMAVRVIRMHLEFSDRVGLSEQEGMIGRRRDGGAPLGGRDEFDDPRSDLDPRGKRIPLDVHIRLANPRAAATADQRIYFVPRGARGPGDWVGSGLV